MLEHALNLARWFCVFPCSGKTPLTSHGCKDASRDPEQIRQWWSRWPTANIAIATGAASGVLVIDVDGPEAEAALALYGQIPDTLEARTGRKDGGRHLYFRHVDGVTIGQGKLGAHLDHRGEGGYVMAPPSVHPDTGVEYAWTRVAPPAELPEAMREVLLRPSTKSLAGTAPAPIVPRIELQGVAPAAQGKSLDEHAAGLATAVDGTKHAALVEAAWAWACAAHEAGKTREVAEPEVTETLLNHLKMNPSPVKDWDSARTAISSAFDRAYSRPMSAIVDKRAMSLITYSLDDASLAQQFADAYRSQVRHVPGQGWYTLKADGSRWVPRATGYQPSGRFADLLLGRALAAYDHELRAGSTSEDARKAAQAIRQRSSATATVLRLAQDLLAAEPDAWDSQRTLLNCPNGVLDLDAGGLRPHDPALALTHMTGVPYEQRDAPHWARFLEMVTGGDAAFIAYLQTMCGSFLYGGTTDDFHILVGEGFNGKTTLLRVLLGVMGSYAGPGVARMLIETKNEGHTSAVAASVRQRLCVFDDTVGERDKISMGSIKSYFGDTPVKCQGGMGKDFISLQPVAKPLLSTNHVPLIEDLSRGALRRLVIVPFSIDLEAQYGVRKDTEWVGRLLAAEGPAILAWMVEGFRRWRAEGLHKPPVIVQSTDAVVRENEPAVYRFIDERCVRDTAARVKSSEFYAVFRVWAEGRGEYVPPIRGVMRKLRGRGFRSQHHRDGEYWYGLRLRTPTEDAAEKPN